MRRHILQRYVLRELSSPTLLGLVFFTFVLLATHLFRLMDLLVNRGIGLGYVGGLVGTLLLPLLVLTVPMAFLVGVLLGVGRLAADNEIMAMRTSGVHLLRVFVPILVVALLLMGGLLFANARVVPRLVALNEQLIDQIKFIVASRIEAGRVFNPDTSGDREVSLYFQHRNPLDGRMEGISLRIIAVDSEDRRTKNEIFVSAREGRIMPDPDRGVMDVVLSSGTVHVFDTVTTTTGFRYYVAEFEELTWGLQLVRKRKRNRSRPDRLPCKAQEIITPQIVDILKHGLPKPVAQSTTATADAATPGRIEYVAVDPDDRGSLEAELAQRRSIPIACLAFALLGVPLAIRIRPTGKAMAFSIAFGLIFFYYIMLKWGVSLSQNGEMLGAFIIFLPNFVVGGMGVFLFYRTLRQ